MAGSVVWERFWVLSGQRASLISYITCLRVQGRPNGEDSLPSGSSRVVNRARRTTLANICDPAWESRQKREGRLAYCAPSNVGITSIPLRLKLPITDKKDCEFSSTLPVPPFDEIHAKLTSRDETRPTGKALRSVRIFKPKLENSCTL